MILLLLQIMTMMVNQLIRKATTNPWFLYKLPFQSFSTTDDWSWWYCTCQFSLQYQKKQHQEPTNWLNNFSIQKIRARSQVRTTIHYCILFIPCLLYLLLPSCSTFSLYNANVHNWCHNSRIRQKQYVTLYYSSTILTSAAVTYPSQSQARILRRQTQFLTRGRTCCRGVFEGL